MSIKSIIYFPAHSGLSPRVACDYDFLCIKYARALDARRRDVSARYAKQIGGSADDLDHAYSHGKNLQRCQIKQEQV
jgi:hypothetical protein